MLVLALLAGCPRNGAPTGPTSRASTPATALAAAASVAPVAARLLQKPAGDVLTLTGTLAFDAGYMAKVAAGRVQGSAYAVADASLIANNAGNIISNNGSTLIADNGAGIVGKTKYGLTQALGAELPIAGMELAVIEMENNQAVPLGEDAAGAPVYAIYSDAGGHYQLYLPASTHGNVRIVARVPGSNDPRLHYDLVTAPKDGETRRFDEKAAIVSTYVRRIGIGLVRSYGDDAEGFFAQLDDVPDVLVVSAEAMFAPFRTIVVEERGTELPAARYDRALQRTADLLLSRTDLPAVMISNTMTNWDGPPEPAIPAVSSFFEALTAAARTKLNADPRYFAKAAYMPRTAATIERPSDLGTFIIDEYLVAVTDKSRSIKPLLQDLGLPEREMERMQGAYYSLMIEAVSGLARDEANIRLMQDSLRAALRAEWDGSLPDPRP